ncbi:MULTISPECIES: GNAT family N-acetyltransferase [Mammaliicoccus]|uniref:GNAT family N-acetyltransferase n=3 Tax=Mammaliicoccus vitulinus TaxID=71237 RepID=A0A2T4PQB0_9STAP|nr:MULTISPECIES: GNAT family N-acetyltransferase [Mammaliicoccus]HAL08779.1 GNAT family N-acetyltransferase [Staphylococcus sp.]MBO3076932.1 GNAT family N-acetyltransferase [Mammaliicoccus vitulinus]PTI27752.1 GNAT family N-acetyltransferase [Mammaliicoccus vitulinus]PTI35037.1 GNAT family N-acetyltransferase [Mammaliicoccus vitulinus]PTI69160.1 GNAT family N-acetyltransferase [Mammaliicoccus vitulinus]
MKYKISFQKPLVSDYLHLIKICDLIIKDEKAIYIGLENALFNVTIYDKEKLIAMGRIVGDGATVFHIIDVAVHTAYQKQGLGKLVMDHIMSYIEENSFKGTYVNLISETPANYLYEKYGFKYVREDTPAMFIEY